MRSLIDKGNKMEDLTAIKRMPLNKDAAPGIIQVRGEENLRLKNGAKAVHPSPTKSLDCEGVKGKK